MSRREQIELHFSHPADRLVAIFCDPNYLVAEAKMLGALECRVTEVARSEGTLEILVEQRTPNRNPFSSAKEIRQSLRYSWDLKGRSCTWTRTAEGEKGVTISGAHVVTDQGPGCTYTMIWDLSVGIPLVGGKLEALLAEGVIKAARDRQTFAANWLHS